MVYEEHISDVVEERGWFGETVLSSKTCFTLVNGLAWLHMGTRLENSHACARVHTPLPSPPSRPKKSSSREKVEPFDLLVEDVE